MYKEAVLLRVGLLHGLLVSILVGALAAAGRPVEGAALGGAAMAVSLVILWAMARSLVVARHRSLVGLLGVTKISLYLGLAGAALTGRIAVDGAGFAAGVGCFLLATVTITLFDAHFTAS